MSEPGIRLPAPPAVGERASFPVLATAAPVVASVALWVITQSPFALLFAVLGPITAIAALGDGALTGRRRLRREQRRFAAELADTLARIDQAHDAERRRRWAACGVEPLLRGESPAARRPPDGSVPVVLGHGTTPSQLRVTDAGAISDPAVIAARERAAALEDAPILADATTGIAVIGPPPLSRAAAAAIALQLLATVGAGARLSFDPNWFDWLGVPSDQPASRGGLLVQAGSCQCRLAIATPQDTIPADCGTILMIARGGLATVDGRHIRPLFLSAAQARSAVERLRLGDGRAALPDRLEFSELPAHAASARLEAVFAVDATGPVVVDLVADGPHALVAGTTGSGKSELLVSWVLSMAAERTPQQVTFLLVDFKGGSAFAPLMALPHCVGVITDLDESIAARALQSLRAEVRYREDRLARLAAPDIDRAPHAFARLVIVVDEYAALVAAHPDLAALFADIASRGRSLGVHLLLCTQRPSGVVSDAVLANTGLRISMRVNNRADSVAVIGTPDAAELPAHRTGRALLDGRPVQVALATARDARAVAESTPLGPAARRPWCDVLPRELPLTALRRPSTGIVFGLADQPDRQRQLPAVYEPDRHGHLLVLGGAGTGKSTLLRTLALGAPSRVVPPGVEAAWDAVTGLVRDGFAGLTLLDDLDSVAAQLSDGHLSAFLELLQRAARDGAGRLVLAARRITAPVQAMLALCDARLLLRLPDRHEHVLAGGESARYDPRLVPGRCHWRGDLVQIARGADLPAEPPPSAGEPFRLVPDRHYVVVSTDVRDCAAALGRLGTHEVLALAADAADPRTLTTGDRARVLVAGPDTWQGWWDALPALRARADVIIDGCSAAQYRALTRDAELPPAFAPGRRATWLIESGTPRRIRLS